MLNQKLMAGCLLSSLCLASLTASAVGLKSVYQEVQMGAPGISPRHTYTTTNGEGAPIFQSQGGAFLVFDSVPNGDRDIVEIRRCAMNFSPRFGGFFPFLNQGPCPATKTNFVGLPIAVVDQGVVGYAHRSPQPGTVPLNEYVFQADYIYLTNGNGAPIPVGSAVYVPGPVIGYVVPNDTATLQAHGETPPTTGLSRPTVCELRPIPINGQWRQQPYAGTGNEPDEALTAARTQCLNDPAINAPWSVCLPNLGADVHCHDLTQ